MDHESLSISEAEKMTVSYEGTEKAEDQCKIDKCDKWEVKSISRPSFTKSMNADDKIKERQSHLYMKESTKVPLSDK